jgi:YbgC/YbaW family acyl-CoA thioester hydrolase
MTQDLQTFYTVRFGDCDPFGHLNNARYVDYLLNAREDHLREFYQFDLQEQYRKGRGWVVLQHEINYVRPAACAETVCIRSGLLAFGPDFLIVEMLMLDAAQKQIKAIMHTRFVPVSLTTGKKEVHAADFMDFLSDKLLPGIDESSFSLQQRLTHWQAIVRSVVQV